MEDEDKQPHTFASRAVIRSPDELLAKDVRSKLPSDVRAVIIAAWMRGGMLLAAQSSNLHATRLLAVVILQRRYDGRRRARR